MANNLVKLEDVKKDCKFKAHQDNKCVNEKNRHYRFVNSCREEFCPRIDEKAESTKLSESTSDLFTKKEITITNQKYPPKK